MWRVKKKVRNTDIYITKSTLRLRSHLYFKKLRNIDIFKATNYRLVYIPKKNGRTNIKFKQINTQFSTKYFLFVESH